MSDRPLAAESIILIEGGAAIGQRPRARSFIIDSDAAALPGACVHTCSISIICQQHCRVQSALYVIKTC